MLRSRELDIEVDIKLSSEESDMELLKEPKVRPVFVIRPCKRESVKVSKTDGKLEEKEEVKKLTTPATTTVFTTNATTTTTATTNTTTTVHHNTTTAAANMSTIAVEPM